jgi:hypothetical protein
VSASSRGHAACNSHEVAETEPWSEDYSSGVFRRLGGSHSPGINLVSPYAPSALLPVHASK